MEIDFPEAMRRRSDAELVEIVTRQRDDYLPEALAAAEAELGRRNLSAPQMEQARAEIVSSDIEKADRADEPLGDGWKVLLVLFPGLLALLIAGAFKADGYRRKHREVWTCTLYGFGAYFALGVSCSIMRGAFGP